MSYDLAQNLYPSQTPSNSENSTSFVQSNTVSTSTVEWFSYDSQYQTLIQLEHSIIVFLVIWSALCSFIYIVQFYYYFRLHHENNMSREEMGIAAIKQSVNPWLSCIPVIGGYALSLYPQALVSLTGMIVFAASTGIKICFDIIQLLRMRGYAGWVDAFLKQAMSLFKPSK